MNLLDTDHMSVLERNSPEATRLRARMAAFPPDDLGTTIVSYEEQSRGWLAISAQARTPELQIQAYHRLKKHLNLYCKMAVIDFDAAASAEFERLKRLWIRIGTMDLKIAAIALANNATVLTRDTQHFRQVPGLQIEDWTL